MHGPLHHPSRINRGAGHTPRRPRLFPGETVEGWVIAEITPYPLRLRPVSYTNAHQMLESFTSGPMNMQQEYFAMQYTPPAAQFVLAVVEYPSGPVSQWGRLHWSAVEIILRSAQEWPAQDGAAPPDTPDLRRLVEAMANEAISKGWEPTGSGRTWCSLRFRQRYACLDGVLQWK